MGHTIEPAASGRAKCRGCRQAIPRNELRLGERLPNPFGDGEMTLWFHLLCGAYKRPEPLLEAMETCEEAIADRKSLQEAARFSAEHRRLPRLDGVQRASTGRARCRSCRELIAKGLWRIPLVYFEDGRFEPSGYIHVPCAHAYFGTTDVLSRMRQFCPDLPDEDLADLAKELAK